MFVIPKTIVYKCSKAFIYIVDHHGESKGKKSKGKNKSGKKESKIRGMGKGSH